MLGKCRYRALPLIVSLTMLAGVLRPQAPAGGQGAPAAKPEKLLLTVGKSLSIDSPLSIQRVAVTNGDLAEAVAVTPNEVLINAKAPGETSLIVWQQGGRRLLFDLTVRVSPLKLDAVRTQIARDYPDEDISVTFDNDTVFVRGTVKDVTSAERILAIAGTLGKTVNLLNIKIPPVEPQIVLKVHFADVDHSASTDLGLDLASRAFNQVTAIGTSPVISPDGGNSFSLSSAVNVLLFRKDIDLLAALRLLQAKRKLEMLAEPNVLAISGKPASFLAGGEFPFPIVQPGQGGTAITISWREYGVRLNFLPVVTPRGTIRMEVAPEVSSLDFTNSLTVGGLTIPALASRKVRTELELESGQSFVIAGLLDNELTTSFSKVPGIGDIPVLGKLFQSKQTNRKNTELLVIITPEVVRPIPAGQPKPELKFDPELLKNASNGVRPEQPGMNKTGPVPVHSPVDSVPMEQLVEDRKQGQAAPPAAMPIFQMVPVMAAPQAPAAGGPAAAPSGGGSGR